MRILRAFLSLALTVGATACEDDGGPSVALDAQAVVVGGSTVSITVRNTGDLPGHLTGCPLGPRTVVERWDGNAWVFSGTRNEDCVPGASVEYELDPGEEIEYTFALAAGRYRFTVTLLVEGRFGEGNAVSNAVDV